jgi:hypothetical protein
MARKKKVNYKIDGMDYEAQHWCFKNNYRIYPVVVKDGFNIHIDVGHKNYEIGQLLKEADLYQEIWNLYKTIYNKKKDAKS